MVPVFLLLAYHRTNRREGTGKPRPSYNHRAKLKSTQGRSLGLWVLYSEF
jgi:hypothetical protein